MKRTVTVFGVILLGSVFFAGTSSAAEKIASVDLAKVFSGYSKAKDFEKSLQEKANSFEAERNKMIEDVKQLQSKVESAGKKDKDAKEKELQDKMMSLQMTLQQKQASLRQEQEEKTKELLSDVKGVIRDYAVKEGYTVVFDSNALIYQAGNIDITDKVVNLLGTTQQAPKK